MERQEIYCHHCGCYVQFDLDPSVNGQYVLDCPNCGHEHCRVVRDGHITDQRWDSRNQSIPTIQVTWGVTFSATSTFFATISSSSASTNGNWFVAQSWNNNYGATTTT